MTISNFEIKVTNCNNSYFAGQTVSGQVVVFIKEKPKFIHGIKLKLHGKAKTHFRVAASTRGARTHYSDEEIYIQEKVYLVGYDNNLEGSTISLPPGRHVYPFSFTLPSSLPSSLTHKYGQVKYYLEATISTGLGITKPNYTCRLPFTVNAILDLNNEYGAQYKSIVSKEKNVCCFCCKSGPVGFVFKVFKTGFVPGEVVKFHAELFNHSMREVSTEIDLVQNMKFHAKGRCKTRSAQIMTLKGPKLKPNETKDWIGGDIPMIAGYEHFQIPTIPPSRLQGCRIIEVAYHLKVRMDVKDAVTLVDCISITIGTIPLRQNFIELGGADRIQSTVLIPGYPDLPLPTYEEATAMSYSEPLEDDDPPPDYMTVVKFIPRYATYSQRSSKSSQPQQ